MTLINFEGSRASLASLFSFACFEQMAMMMLFLRRSLPVSRPDVYLVQSLSSS